MTQQNNAAYWAQRMKNMENALQDRSFAYVQNLEAQFSAAQAEVEKQIAAWYQRFANNNEVSLLEAKRLLTSGELAELRWSVGEYIAYGQQNALDGAWIKQLENASARVHISRLESLKLQMQQQAERLYANQLDSVDAMARRVYTGSYYHTAFELQRGLGVGVTMQALNTDVIEKVLSRPWTADGQTFRDRCWTNKQSLVNSVNAQLTQMIIRGEPPDKAIAAISKQFEVSRAKAGRLVMTESAFVASAAQKDCFNDLDVERYQIVASFDQDTCELCGELDGKVFKMSDYQVGLTAPPFHPWCRCCTCPYFEDMEGLGERWTRNPDGSTAMIPSNISFAEWKKGFLQPAEQLQIPAAGGTIKPNNAKRYFAEWVRGQSKLSAEYGDALEARFAQGSTAAQKAFSQYVAMESVADGAYSGTAHFSSATKKVSMEFAKDAANPKGAGTTFFHEYGHYIDCLSCPGMRWTSTKDSNFSTLLRSDFERYIKAAMKAEKVNKTKAYSLVGEELEGHALHAVSDIFGGLSKNKCMGSYGHRTNYWRTPGAVEREAFAHMFEAQFSNEKYGLMEKYFPGALEEFEVMLAEVVK